MPKSIVLTDRAAALLVRYMEEQGGGLSYSRAIGRLLGVELPRQGDNRRRRPAPSELPEAGR